jgi:hypothetical protein
MRIGRHSTLRIAFHLQQSERSGARVCFNSEPDAQDENSFRR